MAAQQQPTAQPPQLQYQTQAQLIQQQQQHQTPQQQQQQQLQPNQQPIQQQSQPQQIPQIVQIIGNKKRAQEGPAVSILTEQSLRDPLVAAIEKNMNNHLFTHTLHRTFSAARMF